MKVNNRHKTFKVISAMVAAIVCGAALMPACIFDDATDGTIKPGTPHESAAGIPDRYTLQSEKIVNFAKNKTADFYAAHGYSNGDPFNCTWSRDSAVISDGILSMTVSKGDKGYYGAEYRSENAYSYGFYSVCMKAADCPGIVSSFFTYTNRPYWDEIDIEFLGKDMTSVQFNYYTKGEGQHEYSYNLGFDASEGFHEYAFDWQQDYIVWYVDGKAVYKATENIPALPQQIMMNVWNCIGHDEWTGALDESGLPATAEYLWVGYSPS